MRRLTALELELASLAEATAERRERAPFCLPEAFGRAVEPLAEALLVLLPRGPFVPLYGASAKSSDVGERGSLLLL